MYLSRREVEDLRVKYPKGTRIRLKFMDDCYTKLRNGDEGTVTLVDDTGQIHVNWDCGSSLALIEGMDEFIKIGGKIEF